MQLHTKRERESEREKEKRDKGKIRDVERVRETLNFCCSDVNSN